MVKVERNKKEKNLVSMWSLKAGDCFYRNKSGSKYDGIYTNLSEDDAILHFIGAHAGVRNDGELIVFCDDEQVLYFPRAVLYTNEEE